MKLRYFNYSWCKCWMRFCRHRFHAGFFFISLTHRLHIQTNVETGTSFFNHWIPYSVLLHKSFVVHTIYMVQVYPNFLCHLKSRSQFKVLNILFHVFGLYSKSDTEINSFGAHEMETRSVELVFRRPWIRNLWIAPAITHTFYINNCSVHCANPSILISANFICGLALTGHNFGGILLPTIYTSSKIYVKTFFFRKTKIHVSSSFVYFHVEI